MLPLRDINYLLAVTIRTRSKLTRVLSFPSEMQEQVPRQSGRKEQVSQIRRLLCTIERATNDELIRAGRRPGPEVSEEKRLPD